MNYVLGMTCALAMLLITENFIRGSLAFLVAVATLAAFQSINQSRCWYCSKPAAAKKGVVEG